LEEPSLIAVEAPPTSEAQETPPSVFTLAPPSEVSEAINEDLEPHEKLEINLQLKDSGGEPAATSASGDEAASTTADLPSEGKAADADSAEAQLEDDDDLVSDLPYLFAKKNPGDKAKSALVFAEPVGDAVIPGGACLSPDTETLKKYLLLREQDVAILSNQLKAARDHAAELEKKLREEIGKAGELEHLAAEQQSRIDEFEKEKALALEGLQSEIDELKFQNKAKVDKARMLEAKVNEATDEIERLKDRVRTDIRKIRVREKELENKLEIVRKDSEALIAARESKIMELKRKIDLLEFNIDLLQDQNAREKENSAQLRERLAKAAQVVRVAGGLLDSQGKQVAFGLSEHDDLRSEKKGTQEAS
jgi:DNA repair exonuclease SbcCD ATPase subunit